MAGNRAGFRGERSSLWFEFERVLRELWPRWTVIENVPGLLSSGPTPGADFGVLLRGLVDLGYGVAWRVLDARWFGVPQRRRRVFVVGCLGDQARAAAVLAVCECCGGHPATSREAGQDVAFTLAGGSPETSRRISNARNTSYVVNGNSTPEVAADFAFPLRADDGSGNRQIVASAVRASDGHHGHSSPRGDGADNLIAMAVSENQRAETRLTEQVYSTTRGGGKPGQGYAATLTSSGVRRLTPLECERLMGWPDEHTRYAADGREIPDSHRYRLCGNGVVATVAEWIGHRLMWVDDA